MALRNPIRKQFALRLKEARLARGFNSAQEFSHFIGVEPHTYRAYERGAAEPSLQVLSYICGVLKLTPNDLILVDSAARHAPGKRRESVKTIQ